MTKAVRIKTDGTKEVFDLAPGLGAMYAAIGRGCNMIQMIWVNEKLCMWMDEEAKLRNPVPPDNRAATVFCANMDAGLAEDDVIVGDVFLTGIDSEGETADVPAEIIAGLGLA